MWFIYALIAPFFWATANLFDSSLSNKSFRGTYPLVFYSVVTGLPLVLILGFITRPPLPTLVELPYIILIGLLDIAYRFPYLKALQHEDASVTVSLFSLGKLFTPFLAYLFAGELLSVKDYVGFLLIVVSAVLLTTNFERGAGGRRVSKSVWYMLLAALIIIPEAVIWRMVFERTHMYWATGFVWSGLAAIIFIGIFLLIPQRRKEVAGQLPMLWRVRGAFLGSEIFTFTANIFYILALAAGSATLVQGVTAIQPFIVLGYAVLFGRLLPPGVREGLARGSKLKKLVLFAVMAGGVVLIREF